MHCPCNSASRARTFAGARAEHGHIPRGGSFSRSGPAGTYLHYQHASIGPWTSNWLIVKRKDQVVYKGPAYSSEMTSVLSQAVTDEILNIIASWQQRRQRHDNLFHRASTQVVEGLKK